MSSCKTKQSYREGAILLSRLRLVLSNGKGWFAINSPLQKNVMDIEFHRRISFAVKYLQKKREKVLQSKLYETNIGKFSRSLSKPGSFLPSGSGLITFNLGNRLIIRYSIYSLGFDRDFYSKFSSFALKPHSKYVKFRRSIGIRSSAASLERIIRIAKINTFFERERERMANFL